MHILDAEPATPNRPIGYWLKHLDRLIEAEFDRTIGAEQLSRRHWQVLNLLARQPAGHAELRTGLAPFLADDDPDAVTAVTEQLAGRGWVSEDGGLLGLTGAGRAAHEMILEKVTRARRRTTQGIGDEEYLATVDVLRRMADNLES